MSIVIQNNPNTVKQPQADPTAKSRPEKVRLSERRVLLVVLNLFLLLEIGFRFGGDYLSKDIAHLQSFQSLSQVLENFDPKLGTRILFLGNSLSRYGINLDTITEVAKSEQSIELQSVKISPDNTAIAEWYYAYHTYFIEAEISPDVLVIGFEGAHLQDAPSQHPDRLAQYYCSWSDYPKLSQYDLKTFEEKANFAVCKISSAFGNRDRIQRRVFDKIIPDYRNGMDTLNNRRVKKEKKSTKPNPPTYKRLAELILMAQQRGTVVVLAAMPVPEAYEFDPELLALVKVTSALLVDCRTVEGITPSMFFDGLHMDEEAANLYSTALTRKIAPVLKRINNSTVLTD